MLVLGPEVHTKSEMIRYRTSRIMDGAILYLNIRAFKYAGPKKKQEAPGCFLTCNYIESAKHLIPSARGRVRHCGSTAGALRVGKRLRARPIGGHNTYKAMLRRTWGIARRVGVRVCSGSAKAGEKECPRATIVAVAELVDRDPKVRPGSTACVVYRLIVVSLACSILWRCTGEWWYRRPCRRNCRGENGDEG